MRFLIDNALSPRVAALLNGAGHDAIHVRDRGMGDADDTEIFDLAAQTDRVIVSADTDFGVLVALLQAPEPSVILLRKRTPRSPVDQAALLLANLPRIENALVEGAVVVFDGERIRVRHLPILRSP